MHMDADYPFMLPAIKNINGKKLTIVGRGGQEATVKIVVRNGQQYAYIEQSGSLERMFRQKPARFKLMPFKDDQTPAGGCNDVEHV